MAQSPWKSVAVPPKVKHRVMLVSLGEITQTAKDKHWLHVHEAPGVDNYRQKVE
jgi:hypothetical protein